MLVANSGNQAILIPYSSTSIEVIDTTLLVGSVALAVPLAFEPSFRFSSSIGLRALSLIHSSLTFYDLVSKGTASNAALAMHALKIAVVAVGVLGVAVASPTVIVASLAANVALNVIAVIGAIGNRDGSWLGFFANVLTDSLFLGAIISGSAVVLMVAFTANTFVMGSFAFYTFEKEGNTLKGFIKGFCYVILGAISLVMAKSIEGFSLPARVVYFLNNDSNSPISYYNKDGALLATLQPGESRTLFVSAQDTRIGNGCHCMSIYRLPGESASLEGFDNHSEGRWIGYDAASSEGGRFTVQEDLKPEDFAVAAMDSATVFNDADRGSLS